MFKAKDMSIDAKVACKALRFTPRFGEPLNTDRTADWEPGMEIYPVMKVWNSRRSVELTNQDLAYAGTYLR